MSSTNDGSSDAKLLIRTDDGIAMTPSLPLNISPNLVYSNTFLHPTPPFPMSPRTEETWRRALEHGLVRRSIYGAIARPLTEAEQRWIKSGSDADWETQWHNERRLTSQLLAHIQTITDAATKGKQPK